MATKEIQKSSGSTNEIIENEEEIGKTGRGGLFCRVQADGKTRSYQRQLQVEIAPGSTFRVSIGTTGTGRRKTSKVARVLAYIDPLSGKLVVRMGMYDISQSKKGREASMQLVDVSDVPVCDV